MGTQVITTDTGRRLGVVGEVVVDIDRREVVALGLRDNPLTRFLPGLPKWMPLESIKQVGDVILVDSLDSLSEGFSPERYGKVINCQVITESGQLLGRVLGFSFDIETGDLISLVMGAVGVPLLGEGVLSTWEIPVEEIVSSGTDRIIVYEGAEEKLNQLSSGLLEKLGVGGSSWEERELNGYSSNLVPVENQLLSGSESEQQNNLVEEYEEVVEQDDYEDDEELEYVEIENSSEEINNRKKLYMENDFSNNYENLNNVNQIDEEKNIDLKQKQKSNTNLASKRPIQNATETLDIEPLDEQNFVQDNKKSEKFEIDDPW
jgi:sporulation protein YlmC with PRC-barrel domain